MREGRQGEAVVTEIGWEGRMRRRALDTCGLTDAGRWDNLIEQVLASPLPVQGGSGETVYVIHTGDRAVLVGERNLTSLLADLVETILETGDPPLAPDEGADSCRSGTDRCCAASTADSGPKTHGQSCKTDVRMRTRTTGSGKSEQMQVGARKSMSVGLVLYRSGHHGRALGHPCRPARGPGNQAVNPRAAGAG